MNYALWGRWPLGYHVVHLGIHALTCVQVYRLGRLYLAREAAVLAGMLFALYPISVEPVAWLSASYDLLATLFSSAGLVAWGSRRFTQAACLFALALLSKEWALVFPLMALALTWRVEGRRPERKEVLMLVGITAVYLAVRVWLLGDIGGYRTIEGVPIIYRPNWQGMFTGFAFSLSLLFYPVNRFLAPSFPALFILLCGLAAIPWAGLVVPGSRRETQLSLALGGIAYLPVSILHGVHLHGSSRFLYPASVGICLALGALLSGLPWKRLLVPIVLAGQIGLVFLNLIPWETVARESFENTRALLSVHQTFPKDDLMVVITPTDFMGAHLYGNALPYALELYVGSPFKVMALSQEQLEIAKTLSLVPRDVPTHALNRPPIHLRWPAWHPVWTALPR